MLYVEKELNSIIFDDKEFQPQRNYMPDLVLAFRDLNKNETIHFVVNLDKTPLLFILYFRKLRQSMPDLGLELYFKEKNDLLVGTLSSYKLKYKNITEFPWELPKEDNISEVVDPYESIEGIDDEELINSIRAKAEAEAEDEDEDKDSEQKITNDKNQRTY